MADSKTPSVTAGSHYGSYIQYLLSWRNPRDSAIAYLSIVASIIIINCLDVFRYTLKFTYLALAVTVGGEILGKMVLGNGLTSQMRPRKYMILSKDTVDAMANDFHDFANFASIEAQKILYVENVYVSTGALVAAFLSYHLVKIVPYWALAIFTATAVFFGPLVYNDNKEFIDAQIKFVSDLVVEKTDDLRKTANQHTSQVGDMAKQYVGTYSAKAQSLLRGRVEKVKVTEADFPAAPTSEFKKEAEVVEPAAEPVDELIVEPEVHEAEPLLS